MRANLFGGFNFFPIAVVALMVPLISPVADALCVKTNVANLRKGPGPKFPVTWKVGLYMPLLDIEYKNGWYKVKDQDGDVHWVQQSLVARNMQCMAVNVSSAQLRKGPGTEHAAAILPSAGKYYAFKKIGFEPPWYSVEDDAGLKAWIHENNVWQPIKRQNIEFK